jgi:hypothetical protein
MEINLLPARIAPSRWLLPSATMPREALAPLIGLAYVVSLAGIGQLHAANVFLGALGFLDLYNEKTRQFLRTFAPFMITGAIYDSFRFVMPPIIDGHIHVGSVYTLERTLFGVGGSTLNEVFARHHWAIADVIAGVTYLLYVAIYIGLTMVLFFRRDVVRAHTFARGFLVVNLLGFITYAVYPAAPPWYITQHGLGAASVTAAPSAAGALRVDALLGTHLFANTYSHSAAVFGAVPSLHVAYPALAMLLVRKTSSLRWARGPTTVYSMLICASAIYLQHHYVIDVLIGLTYAAITAKVVLAWELSEAAKARQPVDHHPV